MASTVRGSLLVLVLPLLAAGSGLAPAWSAPQPSNTAPAAAASSNLPAARAGSGPAGTPGADPPVVFWEPVDPNAPPPPKTRPAEEDAATLGLPRPGADAGRGSRRIPVLTPPPPPAPEAAGVTLPAGPGSRAAMPMPPGMMPPGARPPAVMPPGMSPSPAGIRQSRPPLAAEGPPLPPGPPPPLQQVPNPPAPASTSLGPAAWLVPLLVLAGGAATFVALRLRQRRGSD